MNDDCISKLKKAEQVLERWENSYLHKAGLKIGQSPNVELNVQLTKFLTDRAAAELCEEVVNAIKARTHLHPVDALTYYRYAQGAPDVLSIYEATFRPRVVVCRPFKM